MHYRHDTCPHIMAECLARDLAAAYWTHMYGGSEHHLASAARHLRQLAAELGLQLVPVAPEMEAE